MPWSIDRRREQLRRRIDRSILFSFFATTSISNFFDYGFASRKIARCPLPDLAQPQPAIGQNFGGRPAFSGHQLAGGVQMLVTHVKAIALINLRDQRAEDD